MRDRIGGRGKASGRSLFRVRGTLTCRCGVAGEPPGAAGRSTCPTSGPPKLSRPHPPPHPTDAIAPRSGRRDCAASPYPCRRSEGSAVPVAARTRGLRGEWATSENRHRGRPRPRETTAAGDRPLRKSRKYSRMTATGRPCRCRGRERGFLNTAQGNLWGRLLACTSRDYDTGKMRICCRQDACGTRS